MRSGMPIVDKILKHKLLLDTHIWIWLMNENPVFSDSFYTAIDRLSSQDGILISPISIWEIGMLVEKKRITLEMDCMDWIQKSLSAPGVSIAPLTPRIAIQSCRLPGNIHGDPADRILLATAHEENAVLVTCDEILLKYGKENFVFLYNPC